MEKCGCESESILDKLFIPLGCKVETKLKIARLEARIEKLEEKSKRDDSALYQYRWALHKHECSIHVDDSARERLFERMDIAQKDQKRIQAIIHSGYPPVAKNE